MLDGSEWMRVSPDAVKGFNKVWRELCRKDSEISIRYQYHNTTEKEGEFLSFLI